VSAVGATGVIYVKLAGGAGYDLGGIGDFGEVGDLEQDRALPASQAAVGSIGGQPPATATMWTLDDDLHQIALVPLFMSLLSIS
jgi:hypothetical protein